MDDVAATYLSDWPGHTWPHPRLRNRYGAMGAPMPPPVLHPIDGHVVFVNRRDGKQRLVVDGVEKPAYDDVLTPRWIAGGKTFLYRALKKGEGWRLVIDDKDGPVYDHVGQPVFSANERHMAYGAVKDKKWRVVIDGKETASYEDINDGQFHVSNDGRLVVSNDGRVAFAAYIKDAWKQIVDGREGFEGDGCGRFYGKNDEHFAYVARKDGKSCVVIDGVPGVSYSRIASGPYLKVVDEQIVFFATNDAGFPREPQWFAVSASQERPLSAFPYHALHAEYFPLPIKHGDKTGVFYRGIEGPLYDAVKLPEASEDGKHVAYAARRGSKWLAVVDGKEGREYDDIRVDRYWFTLDGDHCSYIAMRDKKQMLVVDGKEGPAHSFIYDPMLSHDGLRSAYVAPEDSAAPGRAGSMVIDGNSGPRYDAVGLNIPSSRQGAYQVALFCPQSRHVAYVAAIKAAGGKADSQVVVLDGKEEKRYLGVDATTLAFTSDGRLCYNARAESGWIRVIDGEEMMFVPDARDLVTFGQMPLTWYFVRDRGLFRAACR